MSKSKYKDPVEYLSDHTKTCEVCRDNPFGLCATGFRILGEISGMRDDSRQLELNAILQPLREKPLARMRINEIFKRKQ